MGLRPIYGPIKVRKVKRDQEGALAPSYGPVNERSWK